MDELFDEEASVDAWLSAKFRISRSEHTRKDYAGIMRRFRAFLASQGLCLDPWAPLSETASDRERRRALGSFALKIHEFADRSESGKAVAPRTYNAKLEALSSFYGFCNKMDLLFCGNPVERLDRAKVHPYAESRALNIEEVAARMRAIDRSTKMGARNYALLSVLLETGRRISEVLAMQWKHLTERADGCLEIFFPRTKGGKTKHDVLSAETSRAVRAWLSLEYGKQLKSSCWVWTSLGHNVQAAGLHNPLHGNSARAVCLKILGTTNVHRTRHTWTAAMKVLGASLEERQAGLGHASPVTTQIYDAALDAQKGNPRRDELARLFGFK